MKWRVTEDRHWFKKGQILEDTDYKPQWDYFLEPVEDPVIEPVKEEAEFEYADADKNEDGKVDVGEAINAVKDIFSKKKKKVSKKKSKKGKR